MSAKPHTCDPLVPVGKKHQHSPPIDLQLPDETDDLQPGFDGGAVVFGGAAVTIGLEPENSLNAN